MGEFWNFVENKETEIVELRIDGVIVADSDAWIYEWFGEPAASPNAFRDELKQYAKNDLSVWINSNGGDVFAAAGIYDALKNHKGKVKTNIEVAMSAAGVIAMAGDEVFMSPVGVFMMHNPLSGARGYATDLRKQADVLDTVKETIINAYAAKTKKSRANISALMDDETWMSANVALKEGFIDRILFEENQTENVMNLSFNRYAITNSVDESFRRLMDFSKLQNSNENDDQIKNEKEKLLMELELI